MNPLRDAIKGRRIQIALNVSPEGEVTVEPAGPDANQENMGQDNMMDKGGARKVALGGNEEDDDDPYSAADSPAPEDMDHSESEVKLSPKDVMRAKQIIASGQEPTNIQDKMLVEQFKLQE